MRDAFRDRIRPVIVLACFVGYVVVGAMAFAVVINLWWPTGLSKADAARIVLTDPTISTAQGVISTVLAVVAGYAACQFTGSRGLRNNFALGVLFAFYAALNIHLHANGEYLLHAGQFVGAFLLPLLGGGIRLWWVTRRGQSAGGRA